jgi:hypothetical protein
MPSCIGNEMLSPLGARKAHDRAIAQGMLRGAHSTSTCCRNAWPGRGTSWMRTISTTPSGPQAGGGAGGLRGRVRRRPGHHRRGILGEDAGEPVRLELSPRAAREADRCGRWWRENRGAARMLFEEELGHALWTRSAGLRTSEAPSRSRPGVVPPLQGRGGSVARQGLGGADQDATSGLEQANGTSLTMNARGEPGAGAGQCLRV